MSFLFVNPLDLPLAKFVLVLFGQKLSRFNSASIGFRVPVFGFRLQKSVPVSVFGFGFKKVFFRNRVSVSGFEFKTFFYESGFGFRVPVSGLKKFFQESGSGFGFRFKNFFLRIGFRFLGFGLWFPVSGSNFLS